MITTSRMYQLRHLYEEDSSKAKAFIRSLPKLVQAELASSWAFNARIKQLPPENWKDNSGDKINTLLWLCGRGFGKTRALCEWVIDKAVSSPNLRIALVGRTAADVRDILVNGESGILSCCEKRDLRVTYEPSKRLITFPNGSICQLYTAEKPDQLRGVQFHHAACDELAAWQYDEMTWAMLQMTLRLGEDNKTVIATTPQPTKLIMKLTKTEGCHVVRGSTFDNSRNLSKTYIEILKREYEGTRLGRQELYGEVLTDVPGALWTWEMFKRVEELPNDIVRTVVAIDPAVSSNKNSDETGITVACKSKGGQYYLLADKSGVYTPNEWATLAINLFDTYEADRIIYESNQGGDSVAETIRTVRATVPIKAVRASKGKYARAEPIAALYEQGKVYHIGVYDKLEEQLTTYNPEFYKGSPDRLDALVWALTELKGNGPFGFTFR